MTAREAELREVTPGAGLRIDSMWRIAAAAVGLACLARVGFGAEGLLAGLTASLLVWLAAIDLRERILPNRIVLPATGVLLVAHAVISPRDLEYLVAAAVAGLVFLVPALLRPGALGMGDVKLAMLLGAAFGSEVVAALTIGLFATGVFAIGLVLVRGRAAMKSELPLGPFLALGAILLLLV